MINNIAGLVPGAPGANFGIRDKQPVLPSNHYGTTCGYDYAYICACGGVALLVGREYILHAVYAIFATNLNNIRVYSAKILFCFRVFHSLYFHSYHIS